MRIESLTDGVVLSGPAVPVQIAPDRIVLAVQGHYITLDKEELNMIFRMSLGVDWELPCEA